MFAQSRLSIKSANILFTFQAMQKPLLISHIDVLEVKNIKEDRSALITDDQVILTMSCWPHHVLKEDRNAPIIDGLVTSL